jgi:hypothetical protein
MNEKLEQILDTFAGKITYVRRGPLGVPRMIEINLSVVATDQPYNIAGNIFYVWYAPTRSDQVTIKVNQTDQPAIPYRMGQGLGTPFDKLLITTPAGQTGTMYLLYGTEAPELLEIIDNRAALSGDITDMLAELQGDTTPENWGQATIGVAQSQVLAANANRKSFSIQAKSTNTGIVYVGYDNTVTSAKWWAELQAGQSCDGDDYRGALHAIATIAGQLIGYGEV